MQKKVLYEIQRNKDERIQFSIGSYKDRMYIDMRIFYTDQMSGELKPTKKGLTIPVTLLAQFQNAISVCEKSNLAKEKNATLS